jgi:ssDNA-binding Zn-finger/Zn-ribbon topoisomerase 1
MKITSKKEYEAAIQQERQKRDQEIRKQKQIEKEKIKQFQYQFRVELKKKKHQAMEAVFRYLNIDATPLNWWNEVGHKLAAENPQYAVVHNCKEHQPEEHHSEQKLCPYCKVPLEKKTGTCGDFWGCPNYPKCTYTESCNMPSWSGDKPRTFWHADDQLEKGVKYRYGEISLQKEFSLEENIQIINEFFEKTIGNNHAYTYGIHDKIGSLSNEDNLHVHFMIMERTIDERGDLPKEQYFKRYSHKKDGTLCGGFKKNRAFQGSRNRHMRPEWLLTARQTWAEINNEHFKAHGMSVRISEKSLKNQGVDRPPQNHLGYKTVRDAKRGRKNQKYKYYEQLKNLTKELTGLDNTIEHLKTQSSHRIESITVEWQNECRLIQARQNRDTIKQPTPTPTPFQSPSSKLTSNADKQPSRQVCTEEGKENISKTPVTKPRTPHPTSPTVHHTVPANASTIVSSLCNQVLQSNGGSAGTPHMDDGKENRYPPKSANEATLMEVEQECEEFAKGLHEASQPIVHPNTNNTKIFSCCKKIFSKKDSQQEYHSADNGEISTKKKPVHRRVSLSIKRPDHNKSKDLGR